MTSKIRLFGGHPSRPYCGHYLSPAGSRLCPGTCIHPTVVIIRDCAAIKLSSICFDISATPAFSAKAKNEDIIQSLLGLPTERLFIRLACVLVLVFHTETYLNDDNCLGLARWQFVFQCTQRGKPDAMRVFWHIKVTRVMLVVYQQQESRIFVMQFVTFEGGYIETMYHNGITSRAWEANWRWIVVTL